MSRLRAAVLGSGAFGVALALQSLREARRFEVVLLAGSEAHADALEHVRALGLATSVAGLDAVLDQGVDLVFDTTSAADHRRHAPRLDRAGVSAINLTLAALGRPLIPAVNLEALEDASSVHLLSPAAQAGVPMVHAIQEAAPLAYAEIVSTIASSAADADTRLGLDELVQITSRGITLAGAQRGKAILLLNPADPPVTMGCAIHAVPEEAEVDRERITRSIEAMTARISADVPGYRLKAPPLFEPRRTPWGARTVISVFVEIEGRGDLFPRHRGDLEIMTAAAIRAADGVAERRGAS